MSESDSTNDAVRSDSFWELDCYKRTVRRTEDGLQSCYDIVKMCQERADIEKEYAKKLKGWSKKWTDFYDKSSEYGMAKASMKSSLEEADKLADVHLIIKERLGSEIHQQVKDWKNEHYKKQMVGNCKEAKQFEDDFKKAQKPWKSRYLKVMKNRKDFHNACKFEKSALNQENNAKKSSEVSVDQLRKLQERVDKCKKEVIVTKEKYEQALLELNSYNGRYIEDMAEVFEKTQVFEEKRLNFLKAVLFRLHASLDLTKFKEIPDIYRGMSEGIERMDAGKDLKWWAQHHGPEMSMAWPGFEEYTTDFHTISSKGNRSNDNPVTLTYIHKNDKSTYLNSAEVNQLTSRSSHLSSTSSTRSGHLNSIPEDEADRAQCDVSKGVKVRALYDYEGRENDELSLRVGEVFLKIRDRDEQGWCTGMKDNTVGLFPDNYVELLSQNPF